SSLSVGDRIGSGGYGTVHHAHWQGRKAAIKKFNMNQADATGEITIQREIRLLESLRDKHIIQFYGTTEHDGQLVLVMEFADGGSLEKAIKHRTLDWPNKTRIAQEIVQGLAYIHHMNVLHRDLKSANVLLTRHMEVKLCDFGVAAVKAHSISKSTSSAKGTLRWMAPELFVAKPKYSTKSDMFSLGMVMWEMAANCTTPFQDQLDTLVVMNLVKSGEREELPDDTPEDYHRWVKRCWDHDPDKRPKASEMVARDGESAHGNGVEGSRTIETLVLGMSNMSPQPSTNESNEMARDVADGQYADDMDALLTRANASDAEAPLRLAEKYEKGDGTTQSYTDAFKWYLRAAVLDSSQAQFKTGEYFKDGRGTARNHAVAVYWLQLAAEGGHAGAQVTLGCIYYDGIGVEEDYYQAFTWFCKSADQGNAIAQFFLGLLYSSGYGVEQDYGQALVWYRKSADQGEPRAQYSLGVMYFSGIGVEQDNGQAMIWFRKLADQGDAIAQFFLGLLCSSGNGAEQDYAQALAWDRKSADQGEPRAQHNCGVMYLFGIRVKKDYGQALAWFHKSAEQGDAMAQCRLGGMYKDGRGVKRNYGRALAWFRKSADQGDATAQFRLGEMYHNGVGVDRDYDQAVLWYRKSAVQGDPFAQNKLSQMYKSRS
ncbi:hypothetical protein BGZ73_007023, partial [Actinomortierella ambigua]